MKVALLTTRVGDPQLQKLVTELKYHNITISKIVCARNHLESPISHYSANSYWIRRLVGKTLDPPHSASVKYFGQTFDSRIVLRYINELEVDYFIHKNGPIFQNATIKATGNRLLNCHLSLLPEVRGMSAPEWSVALGFPVGNTIHFIDPGIDTGRIIRFFPIDARGIRSATSLRNTLRANATRDLAVAIAGLDSGEFEVHNQFASEGIQYFKMHSGLVDQVNALLENGYSPSIQTVAQRAYVSGLAPEGTGK